MFFSAASANSDGKPVTLQAIGEAFSYPQDSQPGPTWVSGTLGTPSNFMQNGFRGGRGLFYFFSMAGLYSSLVYQTSNTLKG